MDDLSDEQIKAAVKAERISALKWRWAVVGVVAMEFLLLTWLAFF